MGPLGTQVFIRKCQVHYVCIKHATDGLDARFFYTIKGKLSRVSLRKHLLLAHEGIYLSVLQKQPHQGLW